MDFYFDIGMAVILRIVKDRKSAAKYFAALAKLFLSLKLLYMADPTFKRIVDQKEAQS